MVCCDQTSELADISIGSGWPCLQHKNHSLIITRSEFADNVIKRLDGKDMKILNAESKNELEELKKMHKFKKDFLKPNASILKLFREQNTFL